MLLLSAVKELDPKDVLAHFVRRYETQRAAAEALNISQPYLSDLLKGHRQMSQTMLDKLGLRRTVVARKAS